MAIDGGCSLHAAYRRTYGLSPWTWSKGRQPSGAALHSSREPGELSQWCCHDDGTINIVLGSRLIINSNNNNNNKAVYLSGTQWSAVSASIITFLLLYYSRLLALYWWEFQNNNNRHNNKFIHSFIHFFNISKWQNAFTVTISKKTSYWQYMCNTDIYNSQCLVLTQRVRILMFLLLTAGCVLWLCFVHACMCRPMCMLLWTIHVSFSVRLSSACLFVSNVGGL